MSFGMYGCVSSEGDYIKTSSYVNNKEEHPKLPSTIGWSNLVFRKEDLNDNKWLYVGQDSDKGKEDKQKHLEWCKGWMWILEP